MLATHRVAGLLDLLAESAEAGLMSQATVEVARSIVASVLMRVRRRRVRVYLAMALRSPRRCSSVVRDLILGMCILLARMHKVYPRGTVRGVFVKVEAGSI